MSRIKLAKVSKAYKAIYKVMFESPTHGNLTLLEDEVSLNSTGVFQKLEIKFYGSVFINNKLPEGYSIKIFNNKIVIRNLLGRKINTNNVLFKISGDFEPVSARLKTFSGDFIELEILNKEKESSLNVSNTKFEDNTTVIRDLPKPTIAGVRRFPDNNIDDNTIRGLNTTKPINGYTGKIHYHPKEKVYLSGDRLSLNSKILNKSIIENKKSVNKIYNKLSTKIQRNAENIKNNPEAQKIASTVKPDDENLIAFHGLISTVAEAVKLLTKEEQIVSEQKVGGQTAEVQGSTLVSVESVGEFIMKSKKTGGEY